VNKPKLNFNCDYCEEIGVTRKAEWILVDDIINNRIVWLCQEHLDELIDQFGEDELTFFAVDSLTTLVELTEEINRKWKWYEDMLKRLYAEIDRLKKIAKLDWIKR